MVLGPAITVSCHHANDEVVANFQVATSHAALDFESSKLNPLS
jgi:hypothetical protein